MNRGQGVPCTFSVIDRHRQLKFGPYENRKLADRARDIIRLIPDHDLLIGTNVYVMKDGSEAKYTTDLSSFRQVPPSYITAIEHENKNAGLARRTRKLQTFANGVHVHRNFTR